MNFNIKCENFRSNLLKNINQSDLPVCVIYYIIQNIYNQIQQNYYSTLNQFYIQESQKKKEETKMEIEKAKKEGRNVMTTMTDEQN